MSRPQLEVFLFGDIGFTIDGERVTGFHSSKVSALGYYLADTGRAHTRDALAGLLWPDYDSAQAKKNLRGAIYHLRNHLDEFMSVTRQEVGFVDDGSVRVDCRDFEVQMALAATEQEPAAARHHLEAAVKIYGGDFLAGFHVDETDLFDDWQRNKRQRYRQMVMQAYSTLVRQAIDAVDALAGIQHCTQLLALDPLNEDGHRGLMLLLAIDGRPSAALAQYEQCKQLLWEELGVEPDDETTSLAGRIRDGELSGLRYAQPVLQQRARHNLPAELTPFFGREQEISTLTQHLSNPDTRLVTIVGPGGAGKSRLAIQVGGKLAAALEEQAVLEENGDVSERDASTGRVETFSDGIFFVRLAAIEPGDDADLRICAAIIEALEIDVGGDDDLVTSLGQVLAERRLLLILDNFEQIQSQAGLLAALLRRAKNLHLLVTSRLRLNVRGEQIISLDGLPLPAGTATAPASNNAAIQLFLQAAASASPGFVADENEMAAIARACCSVQGLPLAIELAASWTPLLSCQEIAAQIEQNLDFLSNNMPDLPQRHHSLRAVFDQSWRLLTPHEQQALQRLAIFRSGFIHEAASSITGASLPTLLALLEKSLIRRAEVEDGQPPRFEIPEIIRQFAMEQLVSAGEEDETMAAGMRFYTAMLGELSTNLNSDNPIEPLDQLSTEFANVRAIFTWSTVRYSIKPVEVAAFYDTCTGVLFDFLDIRGRFQEGASLFGAAGDIVAEETLPKSDSLLGAKLRARQAWFLFHLGDHEESRSLLLDCLQTVEATGDFSELLFVLNYLGAVSHHMGDKSGAAQYLARAVAVEADHPNVHAAGITANIAAMVAFASGDLDEARSQCERALHYKRLDNDVRGRTYALNYLGRVFQLQGEPDQARRAFAESLDIAEELSDPRAVATAQAHLGSVALASGQLSGARRQYQIALDTFRRIGSLIETSMALTQLSRIDVAQEQSGDAATRLQEALQIGTELDSTPALISALTGVAHLQQSIARDEDADTILTAMLGYPDLNHEQRAWVEDICASPNAARTTATSVTSLHSLAETYAVQLTSVAQPI